MLRRAARRAGPSARTTGRHRQRDLAARPVADELHRRGQPRRHHPDGRPARSDADLCVHRPRRQQGGTAGRRTRHGGPGAGRAERHQRHRDRGKRLAGRSGRGRAGAGETGRGDREQGPGPGRPGRHRAHRHQRVAVGRDRVHRLAPGHAERGAPGRPGAADRGRARCRCAREPRADRDAVRTQPDRRLARARRARHRPRLRGRDHRAGGGADQAGGMSQAAGSEPGRAAVPATRFHAEYAWLSDAAHPARVESDVLIEVTDGRFTGVTPGVPVGSSAADGGIRLAGLTMPGLANAHSHAFHRALRGRTHARRGSFWTWRDLMYQVAGRLDPDSYYWLARAVYAEMALAGITAVGEFHYVHHTPDGTPYQDPNAMGHALIYAARDAGIRITLLDTLYLTSTVDGQPLTEPQRRFGDRDAEAWAARVGRIVAQPHARIGVAAHSVRAVPVPALKAVTEAGAGKPLHFHLSEQ